MRRVVRQRRRSKTSDFITGFFEGRIEANCACSHFFDQKRWCRLSIKRYKSRPDYRRGYRRGFIRGGSIGLPLYCNNVMTLKNFPRDRLQKSS